MKRAPLVIAATGAGLAAVLGFHTKTPTAPFVSTAGRSATTSPTTAPSTSTTAPPPTTTPSSTAAGGSSATAPKTTAPTTTTPPTTTAPTPTTAANSTRTATGSVEQTQYGDVQVSVTEKGGRITDVTTPTLSAFDSHSEEINSAAAPLLIQEVLSAQSAQIDGVSGATYTSDAFIASLQSAAAQLGIK